MNPTTSLATRDLKNDPWPQSWKMIKIRTRKAPASIASGSVSHHETDRLKYMPYQRSAKGTRVFTICQTARHVDGSWYCLTISFHTAGSTWPSGIGSESCVMVNFLQSKEYRVRKRTALSYPT